MTESLYHYIRQSGPYTRQELELLVVRSNVLGEAKAPTSMMLAAALNSLHTNGRIAWTAEDGYAAVVEPKPVKPNQQKALF